MKDYIEKTFTELRNAIENDTYALTQENINEMSWKIDKLKKEILDMYKTKRID